MFDDWNCDLFSNDMPWIGSKIVGLILPCLP
jgi:hypothetical protein